MGEISERNLFGTGNKLALQANTSGKSTRYNIRFTNPRIYDSQVSGSLEGYDWTREYSDYTRDTIGGASISAIRSSRSGAFTTATASRTRT